MATDESESKSKKQSAKSSAGRAGKTAAETAIKADARSDVLTDGLLLSSLRTFRKGDFSVRLPSDMTGVDGEICEAFNDVVELNEGLASELMRIGTVVGKEGKTSRRAKLSAARGSWVACIDSVNELVSDMVQPVSEIGRVIEAVAKGDLTQSVQLEVEGRPLQGQYFSLAKIINTLVDQLSSFAAEVTRVAREVGTQGQLGVQAVVEGVAGTWRELTDNVNLMASNLTGQVRNIAEVTTAVAEGDLSRKITVEARGEILTLKDTVNKMVDQLSSFAGEVTRVSREVGVEGRLGAQASVEGVAGTWRDLTENVNMLASNLTNQVRNIAEVTTAVAQGDLTKKITVEARGEILELKDTINTMVDQLTKFSDEVTRVAREVGTQGELGGQADVRGVTGTWRELTDNVNTMAGNLTDQVRGIAEVVTAVANGDLRKRLSLVARGEVAALTNTINEMVDTLNIFAGEVTRVAGEVGVEGKLGGQARVPGALGTWRELTDNVNVLAENLTTQMRAIGEVSSAVIKGDLSRTVVVEATGEVAQLRDNVNEMIASLQETMSLRAEQDWLNTNLTRFSGLLQGQRDVSSVAKMILSELAPAISAQHGVFYIVDGDGAEPTLKLVATYAFQERKHLANRFKLGEGLVGQAALEKQRILLTDVPGDYIQIGSGLGGATPLNVVVLPVLFESKILAIIEVASFSRFSQAHLSFLDQFADSLGIVLNSIGATMRTEELLTESQAMSEELQSRQDELQESNAALELQTKQLGEQKQEVERKNRDVEEARQGLEEKAEQLALTSKYKSEFLTNMSHELRTPLNSLLILAQLLSENSEDNLTRKQVEYAETIHASGTELLNLINDILDLSRVESGAASVETGQVVLSGLCRGLERSFLELAQSKGLKSSIHIDEKLPDVILTDQKRLQQILKNLLSNAFKFTEEGGVTLRVGMAQEGWSRDHQALNEADFVVAFTVKDTGIGIPADKQKIIFEAFQQVDGSISRKYGGTGLGLAISRELARLLSGELRLVTSVEGVGSAFTLYLPQSYRPSTTRSGGERHNRSTVAPPVVEAPPSPPSRNPPESRTTGTTSSPEIPPCSS